MPEPLKNYINTEFVAQLAAQLKKADTSFNAAGFQKSVFGKSWKEKELKQRIRHVAQCMNEFLPYPYRKQLAILLKAAPAFRGLGALVFPDFVEIYGLKDIDASLDALEMLTQYSTGEFAIRPFVSAEQEKCLKRVKQWAKHPNEHVRRLASEGIRPRLPWASPLPAFKKQPKPVLEILELLKNDPSEYVRRSVANNLNDITKDNPALVLETAKRWYGKTGNTDKLLKHACRTLLKQGNTEALKVFGFESKSKASIKKLAPHKTKLRIGETLMFTFDLHNELKQEQQLRVEYAVYFRKSNGTHSKKVFQVASKHFPPGPTTIKRTHRFTDFTTRKHYPGEHILVIAVNGVEKSKATIVLVK